VKFLASHLLESDEHKLRLLREAKAAAWLDHPNICMVYEVGESGITSTSRWAMSMARR
jgi:hypothetical protein